MPFDRRLARTSAFAGVFLSMVVATLGFASWLDPNIDSGSAPRLLAFNVLPVLALAIGAWALSRRAAFVLLLVAGLVFLAHHASALKERYLGTPLLPSDFWMVPQVALNPALFAGYVEIAPSAWLAMVAGAFVLALLWRFEPRTFPASWLARIPVAAAAFFVAYATLAGLPPAQKPYASQFGDRANSVWNPRDLYRMSGLLNGLAFYSAKARLAVGTPDMAMLATFDRQHAAALARRRKLAAPKTLPDIFVIQAESLFDPATIQGLEGAELMPEWRRLEGRGIHGTLDSPAYGGVTIRAEFEVLTGYPMRAFRHVNYPYYGLVDTDTNSLPRALGAMGYTTTVAHPFKAGFWNRKVVMQRLGFDHLLFQEELGSLVKVGRYAGDAAFYEKMLQATGTDGPQFVFAITMQNHGPWSSQQAPAGALPASLELPSGMPPEAQQELRAYLWHVFTGDLALGKLANALLSRPRPTLLVIYGDHLPALDRAWRHVKFANGRSPQSQPVPFLVVSNQPLQPRRIDDMGMHHLPALVLESAGLPQPGFFAVSAMLRNGDPAVGAVDRAVLVDATWRDYLDGASHPVRPGAARKKPARSVAGAPPGVPGARISVEPVDTADCRPDAYTALVSWTVPETLAKRTLDVRIGGPSGDLMASKPGRSASQKTGNWVRPGIRFYLVDRGDGTVVATTMAGTYACG